LGWQIFRAGMMSGALIRMGARTGEPRVEAARRLDLYRRGPVRAEEQLPDRSTARPGPGSDRLAAGADTGPGV
jgi:hypothetical protein